jgi:predicted HicB family RNase H-like nuclease
MMNAMSYKGYTARVEFDSRDRIFVGKVLGIVDSISFHGNTVAELTRDFHNSINHYLSDCKVTGRAPQKPASGKLMLRIPPEVHTAASIAAQAAGKSLNQWASEALKEAATA